MISTIALVILASFNLINCESSSGGNSALFYLSQYGYLGTNTKSMFNSSILIDERALTDAIADFQNFAGLDVTGKLDDATLNTMSLPRCGVKDKVGSGDDSRSKRYALQGSRWKVKNLTYRIAKYPRKLAQKDVDAEIARAFAVWSEYTDLSFKPSKGHVHIKIRFENGEHGDGDPFDGPDGTLAHAHFPAFGGYAHFDASEQWSINSYRGTNLFQVAAHVFGHSLGLSHSNIKSALMAPFYRGYEPVFQLDVDDIQGIQALYKPKTEAPPTTNAEDPILCTNTKIDTIFNSAEGETYVFKGNHYWKLTADNVAKGYPKIISSGWPGLPGYIDAAFTYKNGKSYFFKGKQYWRYRGKKVDDAYPKNISEGFTGIPDDLDAAMVWSGNGKIYFFKGSKFWRFDPSQRPPVKSTYPKQISNWEGVPDRLDAAFQYTNGYTYFFKDDGYYRFNDRQFSVDPAKPAFPRSAGKWWLGCASKPQGTIGTSTFSSWLLDDGNDYYGMHRDINNEDSVLDAGTHGSPI